MQNAEVIMETEDGDAKTQKKSKTVVLSRQDTIWGMVSLNAVVSIFFVVYLLLFCSLDFNSTVTLGFGIEVYNFLYSARGAAAPVALSTAVLLVVLVICDIQHWQGVALQRLGVFLVALCVFGIGASVALTAANYEIAPIALYFVFVPIAIAALHSQCFRQIDRVSVLSGLLWTLLGIFLISIGLWIGWLYGEGRRWTVETKKHVYSALDVCNFTTTTESMQTAGNETQDDDLEFCPTAFLIWMAPFIMGMFAVTFSAIMFFLIRAERTRRASQVDKISLDPLAQAFICFITLGVLGLWVAASITSTSTALASSVLTMSFVAILLSTIFAVGIFGRKTLIAQIKSTPLGCKGYELCLSDYGKSLLVLAFSPLFLVHLALNTVTQFIRKHTTCGKKPEPDEDPNALFTYRTKRWLALLGAWDWGSVLVKALWWGVFYFVFFVGVARFTTVFLSVLNEALEPFGLGLTIVIFMLVGITMFLLPPVPGVPVYVTGGIVLSSSAEANGLSFGIGVLLSIALCFTLKLIAVAMQQKLIGQMFGARSVYVRYLVRINSVELRAMKVVLSKPGFSFDKVVVLVGGPDWPTSVMTGILRLPLPSMLLGTLPVIFLIAPSCVAGAMLYKSSDGGIYASLEVISVGIAVIVQSVALFGAFHFIAKMAVNHQKELEAIEDDMEVLALEKKLKNRVRVGTELNSWGQLAFPVRCLHVIAVALMVFSCYCFQLYGSRCFESYAITDSISDPPLNGNAANLVTDFGVIPCAAFTASLVYLILFNLVQRHRVSKILRTAITSSEEKKAETKKVLSENNSSDLTAAVNTNPVARV